MNVRDNVPLAPFCTLGVGGPARHFIEAESEADVSEAIEWSHARGLAVHVLGGGSNLVVADEVGSPGTELEFAL